LTKADQVPKIGRAGLLALVEWVIKHRHRSECVEANGLGANSPKSSLPSHSAVGEDGIEASQQKKLIGGGKNQ
jgi:hypothetical protein